MYYFLPRKSIFACISTYIHSKIFPCEGSNPARGLKYPNVIPHFFKNFFGIWVAKKPDISGFFLHVILLVMLICKFMTKKMTYEKWLFFGLCQNNHIIKIYVTVFLLCSFSSMCEWHMELFVLFRTDPVYYRDRFLYGQYHCLMFGCIILS